jgi:hypothetical protein
MMPGGVTRPLVAGTVLATALVVAVGYGSQQPSASDTMRVSSAETTTAGSPARLVLTLRDQGRTVRVSRSTRITLVLGGRYRWSKPRSTGVRVDVQAVVSDAPTGGQTWELRLLERGRAKLTSTGSPACRPTTPGCPTVARSYTVTLDVRR